MLLEAFYCWYWMKSIEYWQRCRIARPIFLKFNFIKCPRKSCFLRYLNYHTLLHIYATKYCQWQKVNWCWKIGNPCIFKNWRPNQHMCPHLYIIWLHLQKVWKPCSLCFLRVKVPTCKEKIRGFMKYIVQLHPTTCTCITKISDKWKVFLSDKQILLWNVSYVTVSYVTILQKGDKLHKILNLRWQNYTNMRILMQNN